MAELQVGILIWPRALKITKDSNLIYLQLEQLVAMHESHPELCDADISLPLSTDIPNSENTL
ncbi:MAG: hypothetical protein ACE5GU_02045 [Candidatus Scalinduaceae bacterium]